MPKKDNGQSANTWRLKDRDYREREKKRRRNNVVRSMFRVMAGGR